MNEEDEFWTDDYEDGSFKNWLRKKYTGSPVSLCYGESFFECRKDVLRYYDRTVCHIIEQCCADAKKEKSYLREEILDHYRKIADIAEKEGKNAAIEVLNMDDVRYMGDGNTGNLLERLAVEEVLCFGDRRLLGDKVGDEGKVYDKISFDEKIPASFDEFMDEEMLDEIEDVKIGADSPHNQPITTPFADEIFYNYDFGDNWTVSIKGSCGCEDLIEAGRITQEEIDDAIVQVYTTYRPVVIAQDGFSVFDDVGGMTGYCEFLKGTYGKEEYDGPYEYGNKKENLEWAKSLGWNGRMCNNRTML